MDYSIFTPEYFIEKAHVETGLRDFGEAEFMPSYQTLVYALREEAKLTEEGWRAMEKRLVRLLTNRLRLEEDLKKHPEILDEELLPPLVIIGLPRTGSTKLQRMVAASNAFQELLMWQAFNPAPFPQSDCSDNDVRITEAEDFCEWRATKSPGTNAAHHVAARQIEEETYLLEFSFDSIFPNSSAYIPTYNEFIRDVDKRPMYTYLRKMLQYLQWQFPHNMHKPWLLKAPHNLGNEKFILSELPSSKFIVTHRNPNNIVASTAAILKANFILYSDFMDKEYMGRWALEEFSSEISRHMAWRKRNPEVPLLDLSYKRISDSGLDVAKEVHKFLDISLTKGSEELIEVWLKANIQHMHGKHEYSLEEYGLTQESIDGKFGEYMKEYSDYI